MDQHSKFKNYINSNSTYNLRAFFKWESTVAIQVYKSVTDDDCRKRSKRLNLCFIIIFII